MNEPSKFRRFRQRLYRLYYRIKYFPFHAERRRRRRREDNERGFITIQIDACSYDDMQRAINLGYVPNLKRLLERDNWEMRKYPAGLPSATPAAQAAIFYGRGRVGSRGTLALNRSKLDFKVGLI